MPQIAQQDYKIIAPTPGRAGVNDAAVLGELAKAFLLNGTIYDCIIMNPTRYDSGDIIRIICVKKKDGQILLGFIDPDDFSLNNFIISYTPTQYQGLAAVQEGMDRVDGQVYNALPDLYIVSVNSFLGEDIAGYQICTPESYQYKVTLADGKIATIEASTTKIEGDFIAISIEDAQKLIGLPCKAK